MKEGHYYVHFRLAGRELPATERFAEYLRAVAAATGDYRVVEIDVFAGGAEEAVAEAAEQQ